LVFSLTSQFAHDARSQKPKTIDHLQVPAALRQEKFHPISIEQDDGWTSQPVWMFRRREKSDDLKKCPCFYKLKGFEWKGYLHLQRYHLKTEATPYPEIFVAIS